MKIIIAGIIGLFLSTVTFGQVMDSTVQINDPIEYIKKESVGGKLDFNLALEKENKQFYLIDNIAYNKKDFGILLWGASVKSLGISTYKDAAELWEEIHKRKLTGPEKKALKNGFEMEIQK